MTLCVSGIVTHISPHSALAIKAICTKLLTSMEPGSIPGGGATPSFSICLIRWILGLRLRIAVRTFDSFMRHQESRKLEAMLN